MLQPCRSYHGGRGRVYGAGEGRVAAGGGGAPQGAASGTDKAGEGRCFNRAALTTVGGAGCTGQGRGRLSGLCLFNVTVIVKFEAALWGNVPQATGGAVVVNLA